MTSEIHIIIPARFNSSRLPGKMLLNVAGKPLIQRVFERAKHCAEGLQANSIRIATDDPRIENVAREFGAEVIMTSQNHLTGTDRLAEVSEIIGLGLDDIVVNIQGDEPLFPFEAVSLLVNNLQNNPRASMTTLCHAIEHDGTIGKPGSFDFNHYLTDLNVVKVVLDRQGFALYFSREPLMQNPKLVYRHIGMYAYRVETLLKYKTWEPSPLETKERLEQLRFLWQGEKIHVSVVPEALSPGVDTYEDLQTVSAIFADQEQIMNVNDYKANDSVLI